MIFNKKKVFLYSSILLLILIGVYFVNSVGFVSRTPRLATGFVTTNTTTLTNINNSFGDTKSYRYGFTELANWTKGGGTENLTFVLTMNTDVVNVTQINITMPSSDVYTSISGGYTNITALDGGSNTSGNSPFGGNWSLDLFNRGSQSTYVAVFNAFNQTGIIPGVNNLSAGQNISLWFAATAVNYTEGVYNWTITLANTSQVDSGFGVLLGVDGRAPRLNQTNVTDSVNTRTTLSSTQYLKYDSITPGQGINITVSLNDYNMDRVLLVYNHTGGSINFGALRNLIYNVTFLNDFSLIPSTFMNFTVLYSGSGGGQVGNSTGLLSLTSRSDLRLVSPPLYEFSFNISNSTWGGLNSTLALADGTLFKYVFVVYDLYNNSEIINNSNAEYVLARDTANPTVTLTAPSDTTITVSNSIKYTCDGSDTSGLASCSLKLTKPGGTTVTKTGCGTEQTFTLTDTNEAGTNTVECTLTDNVGRSASTSKTFSVSAATTGGGAGGGGGGGSAGSTPDNPVTVQQGESIDAGTLSTTETYTSVAKEGTVTFTVSGSSHSVKVLEVTTDSVTIEISSTPKQVTLTIGETKEVDVDDDGKNDLSVTLKSITNEKADLVFKSLEVSIPTEEEGQPTVPGEGVVTGEEAKTSLTWLWVLIIVVVVILIWVLLKKKR